MRGFTKVAVAAGLLATAVAAGADQSFNAALTSDYRFRGVSQSAQDPAVQGGFDWSDKSGLYFGVWGSTIDFDAGAGADPDADLEVDLYGGYKTKAAGMDWDFGLIHYAYPGSDGDFELPFTEVYAGTSFGPVAAKLFYTTDFTGTTDEAAYYLSLSGNVDLGQGYSLGLGLGYSGGQGIEDTLVDDSNYVDYRIGVSKDFSGFGFNLSYIDTTIDNFDDDVFNAEGTVVFTVSKTF